MNDGTTRISDLAGTGDRMVVADADGDLSTQTIPSGGASSINDLSDALVENNSLLLEMIHPVQLILLLTI